MLCLGVYCSNSAARDICNGATSPNQIAELAVARVLALPTNFDVDRQVQDELLYRISRGLLDSGELEAAEANIRHISATILRAELISYLAHATTIQGRPQQTRNYLLESLALMKRRTTQERIHFFKTFVEEFAVTGFREGFILFEEALLTLPPITDFKKKPPLDRDPDWFAQVSIWLLKGGLKQDAQNRFDTAVTLTGLTQSNRSIRTVLLAHTSFELWNLGDEQQALSAIDKILHPDERALILLRLSQSSNSKPKLLEEVSEELSNIGGLTWDSSRLETALGEIIVEQARAGDLAGAATTAAKIKHQVLDYELQSDNRLKIELATLQALFVTTAILGDDDFEQLKHLRNKLLDSIATRELICKTRLYKCHALGKLVAILAIYDRARLSGLLENIDVKAQTTALSAGSRKLIEAQPAPGWGELTYSGKGELDIWLSEAHRLQGLTTLDHLVTKFSQTSKVPDIALSLYVADPSEPHNSLLQKIRQYPPRISAILEAIMKLIEAGYEERAATLWQVSRMHILRSHEREQIGAIAVAVAVGDRPWAETQWKALLTWMTSSPHESYIFTIGESLSRAALALDDLSALATIPWSPKLKRIQQKTAISVLDELINGAEARVDEAVLAWLQASLRGSTVNLARYDASRGNFEAAEALLAGQLSRRHAGLLHEAIVTHQVESGALEDAAEYFTAVSNYSFARNTRLEFITRLAKRGSTAEARAWLAKERHWNSLGRATLAAYQSNQVETGNALLEDLLRRMRTTRFVHYSVSFEEVFTVSFEEVFTLATILTKLNFNTSATSLLTEIHRLSAMIDEPGNPQLNALATMRGMNTGMLIANGAFEQALENLLQLKDDHRRSSRLRELALAVLGEGKIEYAAKIAQEITDTEIALKTFFDIAAVSPNTAMSRRLALSAITQAGNSGCMPYIVAAAEPAGELALKKTWANTMEEIGAPWSTWVSGLAGLARGQFAAGRSDEARATLAKAAETLSARHLPAGVTSKPQIGIRYSCNFGIQYQWEAAFPGFRPGIYLLHAATEMRDSDSRKVAIQAIAAEANKARTADGIDSANQLIWQGYIGVQTLSPKQRVALGNQISDVMHIEIATSLFQQDDPVAACSHLDTIQSEQSRTNALLDFLGGKGPKWR